nr:leucyl/phenylalanyl-tRNA--protein transferase [Psychrobacter sp. FDAARGOS_221]
MPTNHQTRFDHDQPRQSPSTDVDRSEATPNQFTSNYLFPEPTLADPDGLGLIAIGGDLAPKTLLDAYSQGLFPWFNEDEPIAWWCPEPRCVLDPTTFEPSKSLKRQAKSSSWHLTVNQAFESVIHACSLPRSYANDTWIHDEMIDAYTQLHQLGYAHSIEVWDNDTLVGGLYGLKIGQLYFGESMFHRQSNASKIAFWALNVFCQHTKVALIDCQLPNPHLQSLGAGIMPRAQFLSHLKQLTQQNSSDWQSFSTQRFAVNRLKLGTELWQSSAADSTTTRDH